MLEFSHHLHAVEPAIKLEPQLGEYTDRGEAARLVQANRGEVVAIANDRNHAAKSTRSARVH